jgi:hypothetical protein
MINPDTLPLWLKIPVTIFAVILAIFLYAPSKYVIRFVGILTRRQKIFCATFLLLLLTISLGAFLFAR